MLCTGCEQYEYEADNGPCPICFPYRYRIIAKYDGVIVTDERTNSGAVMQDTVRALLQEYGNVITVFEYGKPTTLDNRGTDLGPEADSILADFFAFEAAARTSGESSC